MESKIIAIDFDGTCVTHEFPRIGKEIGATPVLKALTDNGHRLILFTMRSDIENPTSDDYNIHQKGGKYLTEAVNWFKERNIPLWSINENPEQKSWTTSPKPYAHIYIDDSALGCPKCESYFGKLYVSWFHIMQTLTNMGLITPQQNVKLISEVIINDKMKKGFR